MKKYIIAGATVLVFGAMSMTAYAASTYKPNDGAGGANANRGQYNAEQCINSGDCQAECNTTDCSCTGIGNQENNQCGDQMNRGNDSMNRSQGRNANCVNQ